ncbi:hypothetical protein [Rhizobium sp.]|uniref:endonuclease/exonuclease/phosphatase family protein n=1 Tax=Rhizobium sp. TaxID=391 RepID=UPI0034C5D410
MTPPKGSALPSEEHALVLEVILHLLLKCDILFLGEVGSANLKWLSDRLSGTPFAIKDMTKSESGSKFGLCVLYKEDNARFIGNEFNISKIGGDNYKISCRTDFVLYEEEYFSFLVSHWPSRLGKPEDAEIRSHYGATLRREVERLQSSGVKYLILLGDFNDEPFNRSMTKFLRGCRDADFVKSHPDLLYNPFWKNLVSPKGYVQAIGASDPSGTYYYVSDNLHKWRVFDQMLFGSSFVGRSAWHLNEAETGVFRYGRLIDAVKSSVSRLDHLPIVAEVYKDMTNG